MEENTSLWNKKANDLTVGDAVKINIAAPILVMGSLVLAGAVYNGVTALGRKLRKSKDSTEDTTDTEVE